MRIACTILPENQHALRAVAALGASLRVDAVAFHHTIAIDRATYERLVDAYRELDAVPVDWSGFLAALGPGPGPSSVDPVRLACTLREIVRSAPERTPVEVLPPLDPSELPRYYNLTRDFLPDTHPNRCLSPWMTAYVFPNGAIRPCPYSNYDLGRLGARPFLEHWNGARAEAYREDLRKRAVFPACGRCTELYRA